VKKSVLSGLIFCGTSRKYRKGRGLLVCQKPNMARTMSQTFGTTIPSR